MREEDENDIKQFQSQDDALRRHRRSLENLQAEVDKYFVTHCQQDQSETRADADKMPDLCDSSDEDDEFVKVCKKNRWIGVELKNKYEALEEVAGSLKLKNKFDALEAAVGSLTIETEATNMMLMSSQMLQNGWKKVTVTVDSGSADHVAPEDEFNSSPLEESEGSKKGRRYIAANGQKVPNLGQRVVKMSTDDGLPLQVCWQVTKVVKPLLSVSKVTSNGNVVVLDKNHPRIIGADGQITWLRRVNGTYECDLWVKEEQKKKVGFMRP